MKFKVQVYDDSYYFYSGSGDQWSVSIDGQINRPSLHIGLKAILWMCENNHYTMLYFKADSNDSQDDIKLVQDYLNRHPILKTGLKEEKKSLDGITEQEWEALRKTMHGPIQGAMQEFKGSGKLAPGSQELHDMIPEPDMTWPLEILPKGNQKCKCDMTTLMRTGCTCGGK